MQIFSFLTVIAITTLNAHYSIAQVNLPIDASNCAILNALQPNNNTECLHTSHLGQSRGLIVNVDTEPAAQQQILQLPNVKVAIAKKPNIKSPKIDRRVAKSENGYYIHFAFDSEVLTTEYRDHLKRLAVVLNSDAMVKNCVKITGHTDTVGDAKYNLELSDRRAKSVYSFLKSLNNIDPNRLSVSAMGEAHPLPDKAGSSPFNRRVEFSSKTVEDDCISKS
ncbi:OmpA family protein [Amylibacter sp. SFDW26]|uniref:OmpA family protein n=1 Tax=Amylibacter sp. SFDW26 TaxID=2652722 RepID=UPI00126233F1|nr:OmpA family protein [Amylibacter sp. SFDW26]KAB7614733.1 OmpA family protein [Amylibacter sp. SFDW26]